MKSVEPQPNAAASASSPLRDKLTPDLIDRMREAVEGSTASFRQIGEALGISAATVSRYAAKAGWRRPHMAARPARIARPNPDPVRRRRPGHGLTGEQRERIADKLWRLAERHADGLEDQPAEIAHRSLQPLARLTRALGEMDKHLRPAYPPEDPYYDVDKPRGRSIHELRDELAAHLERIQREEGYGWEVREWWFEGGGGI